MVPLGLTQRRKRSVLPAPRTGGLEWIVSFDVPTRFTTTVHISRTREHLGPGTTGGSPHHANEVPTAAARRWAGCRLVSNSLPSAPRRTPAPVGTTPSPAHQPAARRVRRGRRRHPRTQQRQPDRIVGRRRSALASVDHRGRRLRRRQLLQRHRPERSVRPAPRRGRVLPGRRLAASTAGRPTSAVRRGRTSTRSTTDGTSLFVGGNFTTMNGSPANRLVKLNTQTGAGRWPGFAPARTIPAAVVRPRLLGWHGVLPRATSARSAFRRDVDPVDYVDNAAGFNSGSGADGWFAGASDKGRVRSPSAPTAPRCSSAGTSSRCRRNRAKSSPARL